MSPKNRPACLIEEDRHLSRFLSLTRHTMFLYGFVLILLIAAGIAAVWLSYHYSHIGQRNIAFYYNVMWGACVAAIGYIGWRMGDLNRDRREASDRHEVVLQILNG